MRNEAVGMNGVRLLQRRLTPKEQLERFRHYRAIGWMRCCRANLQIHRGWAGWHRTSGNERGWLAVGQYIKY